jgi:hypothetical protein
MMSGQFYASGVGQTNQSVTGAVDHSMETEGFERFVETLAFPTQFFEQFAALGMDNSQQRLQMR